MTTRQGRIARESHLLGFAEAHADGFTRADAAAYLGCSMKQVGLSIAGLRMTLAGTDRSLAWEPTENRYRLVTDYEDSAAYRHFQLSDLESRLITARGAAESTLNATDPSDPDHVWAELVLSQVSSMLTARRVLRQLADLQPA